MVIAREQRRSRDAAIRLSTIDPLTGLFNRTFFFAAVDREIARSARSNRGFCLLMMDLDELKAINDRHGHYFGDRVLGGVGEVIRSGVRKIDTAARYGGDEFVVLLPETDPTGAYVLAEKVRIGVTELDIPVSGRPIQAVDLGRRRQLSRRRPDERRAADQRRPGDVRLEAGRQEPGDGLPGRRRWVGGRLGVASGHAGARPPVAARRLARPARRLLDPGDPGGPPRCRASTSARRPCRSTRPSRSRATTPPRSAPS